MTLHRLTFNTEPEALQQAAALRICGMRRADPKHRGKRAERCSQIQKRQAQEAKK